MSENTCQGGICVARTTLPGGSSGMVSPSSGAGTSMPGVSSSGGQSQGTSARGSGSGGGSSSSSSSAAGGVSTSSGAGNSSAGGGATSSPGNSSSNAMAGSTSRPAGGSSGAPGGAVWMGGVVGMDGLVTGGNFTLRHQVGSPVPLRMSGQGFTLLLVPQRSGP